MIKTAGYTGKITIEYGAGKYVLYVADNHCMTRKSDKAIFSTSTNPFRNIDVDSYYVSVAQVKEAIKLLGLKLDDKLFINRVLPKLDLPEYDYKPETSITCSSEVIVCTDSKEIINDTELDTKKKEAADAEHDRFSKYLDTVNKLETEAIQDKIYNSTEYDNSTVTLGSFLRHCCRGNDEPDCMVSINASKIVLDVNSDAPEYFMTVFEHDSDYYIHTNRMLLDNDGSIAVQKVGRVEAKIIPTICDGHNTASLYNNLENARLAYCAVDRDIEMNMREAYRNRSVLKEINMDGMINQHLHSPELSTYLNNMLSNSNKYAIPLSIVSIEEADSFTDIYTYLKDIQPITYEEITGLIDIIKNRKVDDNNVDNGDC